MGTRDTGCRRPCGSTARKGFTLIEVLISALVLAIALTGVATVTINVMKRSSKPYEVETAALLAGERLEYFRGQPDPYMAVGGTYYAPPTEKAAPDFNTAPDGTGVNIVCNNTPTLFVREYLYGVNEKTEVDHSGAKDLGRADQDARLTAGETASNQVPPTPVSLCLAPNQVSQYDEVMPNSTPTNDLGSVNGVLPNPDWKAAQAPITVSAGTGAYQQYMHFVYAPRANDTLREGSILGPDVKYVREVWIQTNNPNFSGPNWPDSQLSADLAFSNLGLPAGAGPMAQQGLPPYVVAVTVRVFARQTTAPGLPGRLTIHKLKFKNLDDVTDGVQKATFNPLMGYEGRGYDPLHPLAEEVGYFALQRLQQ